ncbi:hypothetical protein BBF96_13710 [Anoxybacter fermentans]|uniref:Uncharacterized protein n=1 Tax=Anoxybacter fermentans TaxID=1323375 RepID=A0A3S9T1E6_9FIRM|nr:hypothetical protein BBF96_13710 [Anoxybacter fermentans]
MVAQAFAKNGSMVQEQLWTNLGRYEEWRDYVKRARSGQKVKASPLTSFLSYVAARRYHCY